ncbi:hypothetical protein ACFQ4C_04545 [Larkinella insperata]|uniref:Tryptophan-rich sensory protein n=1 Tax=Larkinella insperata TaxID=332158 RepID=A0ABW3Q3H9_9BACT|nr:hypothetical protein [Larkinella insperata]
MALAWIISGVVLAYYCGKALRAPGKPNWNKAIVSTIFWPLSIVTNWLADKQK